MSHLEAFMFYVGSGCFVQDRVQPLLCRPHMSNNFGTDHPSPLKRVKGVFFFFFFVHYFWLAFPYILNLGEKTN